VLLFEVLTAKLPNYFSIVLGAVFILIVFALPRGVMGLIEDRYRQWRELHPDDAEGADADHLLVVRSVGKSFGGLRAVDDASFEVEQGQILGLIGPNGSGKTTLLNMLSGALTPSSGEIRLSGVRISGLPAHQIARLGLARTFQLVRVLPSMSVAENVASAALFRAEPATGQQATEGTRHLLGLVGLAGAADKLAGDLTYIDQKRLELARALALEPKLLLLDEWLAGLNPSELEVGMNLIGALRDKGVTIIMVEHVMDAIRALCSRCIVMNAGRIIARGTPDEVLGDPQVIAAYLGEADA
jgi:branched-chain amino acid transport system permease protein